MEIQDLLKICLNKAITDIDSGTCEMSLELMEKAIEIFAHTPISKALACLLLNLSRSRFDTLIREGKLPKGKKRLGFNELVWYKDELILNDYNA